MAMQLGLPPSMVRFLRQSGELENDTTAPTTATRAASASAGHPTTRPTTSVPVVYPQETVPLADRGITSINALDHMSTVASARPQPEVDSSALNQTAQVLAASGQTSINALEAQSGAYAGAAYQGSNAPAVTGTPQQQEAYNSGSGQIGAMVAAIATVESGGDPTAVAYAPTAYGYATGKYQFVQPTWDTAIAQAAPHLSQWVGVPPKDVPEQVQDELATAWVSYLFDKYGTAELVAVAHNQGLGAADNVLAGGAIPSGGSEYWNLIQTRGGYGSQSSTSGTLSQPGNTSPGSYVVQSGDTLFAIANQYGTTVDQLAASNGISNPNQIRPGQQLAVPVPVSSSPATVPVATPAGSSASHVVQSGDTLYAIAAANGTTVDAIAAANGISNPNQIEVGQQLVMPGASATNPTHAPSFAGTGRNPAPTETPSTGSPWTPSPSTGVSPSWVPGRDPIDLSGTHLDPNASSPAGSSSSEAPPSRVPARDPIDLSGTHLDPNAGTSSSSASADPVHAPSFAGTGRNPTGDVPMIGEPPELSPPITAHYSPDPLTDVPSDDSNPLTNAITAESWRVSSSYGMRTHPITGEQRLHGGVDVAAPAGTMTYSPFPGEVVDVGFDNGRGNYVTIRSADGHTASFFHNSEVLVAPGQKVQGGQRIARVGSTGASTGPHIHMELRTPNGDRVDPLPFITGERQREAAAAFSTSDTREIQEALKARGYDPGPIDGQWGPQTESALNRFLTDRYGSVS